LLTAVYQKAVYLNPCSASSKMKLGLRSNLSEECWLYIYWQSHLQLKIVQQMYYKIIIFVSINWVHVFVEEMGGRKKITEEGLC